jgi:hypothetical protein
MKKASVEHFRHIQKKLIAQFPADPGEIASQSRRTFIGYSLG